MAIYYDEITIHKVRQAESTAVKAYLSNQRHIVPCDLLGNIQSHTNAKAAMRVFVGMADDTASWAFTRADSSGVTTSITGNMVKLVSMSEDVAYTDITASKSGQTPVTLRVDWIKSKAAVGNIFDGVRGPVTVAAATGLTAWDSGAAAYALNQQGFGAPKNRDIVTLYNVAAGWTHTRFYFDGVWVPADAFLDGNLLLKGTMAADRIITRDITADQIKSDSVTHFDAAWEMAPNGTVVFPFEMLYPGRAMALGIVSFTLGSAPGATTEMGLRINSGIEHGYNAGTHELLIASAITTANLPAGTHHVYMRASRSDTTLNHEYGVQILRSYA